MSLIATLAILSALIVVAILSAVAVRVFQKRRQAAYEAFIAGLYAGQQPHDYLAQRLDPRALRKLKPAVAEKNGPNSIEIRRSPDGTCTAIHHANQPVKRPTGDAAKLLRFRESVARGQPDYGDSK